MALMRNHDSSMKIRGKKLCVLLTIEASKLVSDISCISAKANQEHSIDTSFVYKMVSCEIMGEQQQKTLKIFKKCFEVTLLN